MKFTLTILDASVADIQSLLAIWPTGELAANVTQPADDDDNNAPVNVNAPAYDKDGLPWDERIHSKNKATNTDGTWRKRRGVTGQIIATVEAELKARIATMQPQFAAPPAPAPITEQIAQFPQGIQPPQFAPPPAPVQMQPGPQFAPPPAPIQMQQPTQFSPPPIAPAPTPVQQFEQPQQTMAAPTDFQSFMTLLTTQMRKQDGNGMPLIDANYLGGLAQRIAHAAQRPFAAVTDLQTNPDLIGIVYATLQADGKLI